jgi:hypothetical protein
MVYSLTATIEVKGLTASTTGHQLPYVEIVGDTFTGAASCNSFTYTKSRDGKSQLQNGTYPFTNSNNETAYDLVYKKTLQSLIHHYIFYFYTLYLIKIKYVNYL